MRRRRLLSLAGAGVGAVVLPARAQKMPRVGVLMGGDPEPIWTLFRKAMADLGYLENRTIKYEYRVAFAGRGELPAMAAELVALNVDVIVAVLTPAINAAKAATTTIPIVFYGGAIATGTVTNIARPAGNFTGVSGVTSVLAGKSVQLFQEIKPATKALGLLLNEPDPFRVPLQREVETAGKAQQIEIVPMMVKGGDELPAAYEEMVRRRVDGALVHPSLPLAMAATLALKNRLAAVSYFRAFALAGGLISLGPDWGDICRIMAGYADRVLKGTRPGDLPVQQATKVELVVNQKTARSLGLTLSPMFLTRADEVIE
ncbi:MAG TPA: ABC transporter substrate-binding protein [Dongiaceae bacterium]|jgi:putative ABC transport system substrate-binding protein|nr:ABC transporter substrate-binding protein [Dongiaceae bacterium]